MAIRRIGCDPERAVRVHGGKRRERANPYGDRHRHNSVTGSIPIGGGSGTAAACVAVAPNGKRLYVSSDAGTVTVVDINP